MKTMKRAQWIIMLLALCTSSIAYAEVEITDGETFHYRTSEKGRSYKTTCTYRNIDGGYAYSFTSPHESWDVSTTREGRPRTVVHRVQGNKLTFTYNGNRVILTGMWNGEPVEQEKKFNRLVTSENALLLRTHNFEKQKELIFEMQQPDAYPELKTMTMVYEYIGKEHITVPAGTFQCKKIRFSLTGVKSILFSADYYITDDERRIIVKSDNMPVKGESVLTGIDAE